MDAADFISFIAMGIPNTEAFYIKSSPSFIWKMNIHRLMLHFCINGSGMCVYGPYYHLEAGARQPFNKPFSFWEFTTYKHILIPQSASQWQSQISFGILLSKCHQNPLSALKPNEFAFTRTTWEWTCTHIKRKWKQRWKKGGQKSHVLFTEWRPATPALL